VKILYTSDLHGKTYLYHGLSEFAISLSAETIVLGGDLLPSVRQTEQRHNMIPRQKNFIKQFFRPFFRKLIETTTVKQIFLIPGNWDMGYPYLFDEPIKGLNDLSGESYLLDNGFELIGYPFVPPTPFWPKDYEKMDDAEVDWPPQANPSYIRSPNQGDQLVAVDPSLYFRQRDSIREDLERLPNPIDYKKAIYIMHSPPYGTGLDVIPGAQSVGSRSITAFIETHQPLLTLHGHIHESPEISGRYFDRIGNTLSVNPGQITCDSKLHAVIFEAENPGKTLHHTCFATPDSSHNFKFHANQRKQCTRDT
jgi:Icc-related predicted phosphoesterase